MRGLAPVRTVAPSAADPLITLADTKAHLRQDETDDDDLIYTLIVAATEHLDGYSGILGRALITQTWRQDFEAFSDCMRLPLAPLVSVDSVTYLDTADAPQTLATTVYEVAVDDIGPFVTLKPGQSWPSTSDLTAAVSIIFQCGYGNAAAVPLALKQAALLLIGHWYENREAVAAGAVPSGVPHAFDALTGPYRRIGV